MFSTTLFDELSYGLEQQAFDFILKDLRQSGFEKCQLKYRQDPLYYAALYQLHIRQKYRSKFTPVIEQHKGWLFPPGVAVQQASHYYTALFKSSLVKDYHTVVDLTGGLGMDAWAFAQQSKKVIYVEQNSDIFQYATFNFKRYFPNVECYNQDALSWLESNSLKDEKTLIYADPARRDSAGRKILLLHEHQPDPRKILQKCVEVKCDLMLKMSPMADIHYLRKEMGYHSKIYVLGVGHELKELTLFYANHLTQYDIETWLCGQYPEHLHTAQLGQTAETLFVDAPENLLYIPHPALCKTHSDTILASSLGLNAFHPQAKVYTSAKMHRLKGWRIFETLASAARLKDLKVNEAMIVTGHFPLNADQIRKKHKLKESDHTLLVATKTYKNKNLWILAKKIVL